MTLPHFREPPKRDLASIIAGLFARAHAAPGTDCRWDLRGGARIAARVEGTTVKFVAARRGAPVGPVELLTFQRDARVPAGARRLPATGQATRVDADGATWHLVGWVWEGLL